MKNLLLLFFTILSFGFLSKPDDPPRIPPTVKLTSPNGPFWWIRMDTTAIDTTHRVFMYAGKYGWVALADSSEIWDKFVPYRNAKDSLITSWPVISNKLVGDTTQINDVFIWQNDTILKDSLVYFDVRQDSVRLRYINGSYSKWYLSGDKIKEIIGDSLAIIFSDTAKWNAAYRDKINSLAFTGTTTKTLTLIQQDGGTVTGNFTDLVDDADADPTNELDSIFLFNQNKWLANNDTLLIDTTNIAGLKTFVENWSIADETLYKADSSYIKTGIRNWYGSLAYDIDANDTTYWGAKQAAYTNLTSIGSLANAAGWLKNNGSGSFSYSTPSYSDVGAAPVSGSANYVQISPASAQSGGLWLDGNAKANVLQSTVATGTAPLTVASTTLVSNLNADLLDGKHASDFQLALINPITGTGSAGQVAFFNGTTTQTGDNELVWDNTNKRLGIGTTAPSARLNIYSDGETESLFRLTTAWTSEGIVAAPRFEILQNEAHPDFRLFSADATNFSSALHGVRMYPGFLEVKGESGKYIDLNWEEGVTVYGGPSEGRLAVFPSYRSQSAYIRNDKFGVGESSPGSRLSVSGGATIGASYSTIAAPSNGLLIEGNVGILKTDPATALDVNGTTTSSVLKMTTGAAAGAIPVSSVDGTMSWKALGTALQLLRVNSGATGLEYWSPNYITGISGSDVTTALGYTPYNATNPAGYITSSSLSGYATLAGTQTFTGINTYNSIPIFAQGATLGNNKFLAGNDTTGEPVFLVGIDNADKVTFGDPYYNAITRLGNMRGWVTVGTTGKLSMSKYGTGAVTGTGEYSLQVDASGNIIEAPIGGSVSWNDLTDKPDLSVYAKNDTLPSYYLASNPAGYITSSSLSGYATENWVWTNYDNYIAWIPYVNGSSVGQGVGSWGSFNFVAGSGITLTPSGLSVTISASGSGMVYPGAGIPVSTGSAWGTSITNNSANWNTAYGWGNHASEGYLTSESDPVFTAHLAYDITAADTTRWGTVGLGVQSVTSGTTDQLAVNNVDPTNPIVSVVLAEGFGQTDDGLVTGEQVYGWVSETYLPLIGGTLTGALYGTSITLSGNLTCAEGYRGNSDVRLKKNIKNIEQDVSEIKMKQFEFKSDSTNRIHYGVIAQEVEKIAPELVSTDESGIKSVAYIDLIIAKIDALEKENKKMKERIKKLERKCKR